MNKPTIPTTWTTQQAWSVYQWLHELAELVWDTYDDELQDLIEQRAPDVDADVQLDLPF